MSKYKLILFDLWDTLIKIPNLDILVSETNKALGDDRYSKMKDHFIKWHTSNKTEKTFIEDLPLLERERSRLATSEAVRFLPRVITTLLPLRNFLEPPLILLAIKLI